MSRRGATNDEMWDLSGVGGARSRHTTGTCWGGYVIVKKWGIDNRITSGVRRYSRQTDSASVKVSSAAASSTRDLVRTHPFGMVRISCVCGAVVVVMTT
jgi:hypothetical protein